MADIITILLWSTPGLAALAIHPYLMRRSLRAYRSKWKRHGKK